MGEWGRVEVSYLRPNRTWCSLCGQPLAGRVWTAKVEGTSRVFCSPDHEEQYVSYWIPRYGGAHGRVSA